MSESASDQHPAPDEEQPPFGSWNRMYAFVLGCLGIEIVLFYVFTRIFE